MKGLLVFLAIFLFACNAKDKPVDCDLSRVYVDSISKVLDTVTVGAEGKIIDLCTSKGISAHLKFKNNDFRFDFVSDSTGAFKTSMMPSGTYLVSAKQKKYKSLSDTLIEFRSGQVLTLDIALAPE